MSLLLWLVGGMSVNTLTEQDGLRRTAMVSLAVVVLAAANWMRRQRPQLRIVRWCCGFLLISAAFAAVAAAAGPPGWSVTAMLVVVILTGGACLAQKEPERSANTLVGISAITLGVMLARLSAALLQYDALAFTAVGAGFALMTIWLGIGFLRNGAVHTAGALVGCGVAVAVAGAVLLYEGELQLGLAHTGFGLAIAGVGVGQAQESRVMTGALVIAAGAGFGVVSTLAMSSDLTLKMFANLVFGFAIVALGVTHLKVTTARLTFSVLTMASAVTLQGVLHLRDGQLVGGMAFGGLGIALAMLMAVRLLPWAERHVVNLRTFLWADLGEHSY